MMDSLKDNIVSADIENGWILLDYHRDTEKYHLKLKYFDGEEEEIQQYKYLAVARKRFDYEAEKLQ